MLHSSCWVCSWLLCDLELMSQGPFPHSKKITDSDTSSGISPPFTVTKIFKNNVDFLHR